MTAQQPGSENTADARPSGPPRKLAVFDFDGTLSWLRHGWPALMKDVMLRHLPPVLRADEATVDKALEQIILGLNGKPTLLQMVRFSAWAAEHGHPGLDPERIGNEYQAELDLLIQQRVDEILSGTADTDAYVVFGARALLTVLQENNWTLAILSTTIEERVKHEAELLGLTPYFCERMYGGTGDPAAFSKHQVLVEILQREGLQGQQLIALGDGPVEIQATKALGGWAIGIATDEEHNGSGRMDDHKKKALLAAGADAVLPDFQEAAYLMEQLCSS